MPALMIAAGALILLAVDGPQLTEQLIGLAASMVSSRSRALRSS